MNRLSEAEGECWCSQWDEATSTMHRCMWRALDFGCCGKGGPCGCSPVDQIQRQVAKYAADNPAVLGSDAHTETTAPTTSADVSITNVHVSGETDAHTEQKETSR